MRELWRKIGKAALATTLVVSTGLLALSGSLGARPAQAQQNIDTFPEWMNDSFYSFNRYLGIWEYFRDGEETRFNVWTETGDPFNTGDDFFYVIDIDTNGNVTVVWPWGSRFWSGQRPNPRSGTSGDDRPYCNVLTLRVEDSSQPDGYQYLQFPEDGVQQFSPPVITLPRNQGFFAPYDFDDAGAGIDLTVNQKTQFARDLIRVEVVIRNNSGQTRRVGARMLLDPYVDRIGSTRSIFIPKTRERVFFERDYTGAFIPDEWEIYDFDDDPNPVYVGKAILRGNGATTPSRLVIGNALDMYPVVEGGTDETNYQWVVRPEFELRIADICELIYWDPIAIPAGQSRSFVTYIGLGVASHGMSDAYIATQGNPSGFVTPQGFVGAVQAPFALPVVNGNADTQEATVTAFFQSAFAFSMPDAFAFIDLPVGLKFGDSDPNQSARIGLGNVGAVGGGLDEVSAAWVVQPDGDEAGLLPVDVTFGNSFQDTARTTRVINVPQGRKYVFTEEWRMFTFPFNYQGLNNDPVDVFRLAVDDSPFTQFQVLRYNPQINQYEQVNQLRAGEGYWVRTLLPGRTEVRLANTSEPIKLSVTDVFQSPLQRGWNQSGNPSPYAVRVADLQFSATGSQLITFDDAVRRNLIRSTLFHYNRLTGRYEALDRNSIIKPGHGVWLFSNAQQSAIWPPPQGPQLNITP